MSAKYLLSEFKFTEKLFCLKASILTLVLRFEIASESFWNFYSFTKYPNPHLKFSLTRLARLFNSTRNGLAWQEKLSLQLNSGRLFKFQTLLIISFEGKHQTKMEFQWAFFHSKEWGGLFLQISSHDGGTEIIPVAERV